MSAEISRAWRWSPGPWVGMEMTGWFRLLVRNRFAVGPGRLPRLGLLTLSSLRLKVLMELFPQAQFVHIVRNPYVVFPSTVRMLQSLYGAFGLQRPTFHGLEEYVFENFERLYEKLDAARPQLDDSRFYELRYEDLVHNPLGQLGLLYESLELGDFDQVVPRLRQYLAETANYRTNRYDLPPELRDRITHRWGHIIRRYGYTCGSPRS
jgi:hypothetical protein